MGTKEKRIRVPTDANMSVRITMYIDLEDGDFDGWWGKALEAAANDSEDELREALEDEFWDTVRNGNGDADDVDFDIDWNGRSVDVCEWCESPTCEGDPRECESAPEWCFVCDRAEDDCTCEDDDEDDDEVELSFTDETSIRIVTENESLIAKVRNMDGDEEEALL